MSQASRDWQKLVTGRDEKLVYSVNGADFDGFKSGKLLEAKGNYDQFFEAGQPKSWWENTGGRSMLKQAENQVAAASGTPIEWHFKTPQAANWFEKQVVANGWVGKITVIKP
jgi:hypothetical protein